MADVMLRLNDLRSGYGQLAVLDRICLDVRQGEIVAIIGANGAGKSTLLLTISGHLRARSGSIHFEGADITRLPAHAAAARGLVLVPEGGRLFGFMTVLENLQLGAYHSAARACMTQTLQEVMELFPILAQRRDQMAGRLSGGERQMCAIARAIMGLPKLLMLDEPSLGLAPIMVERVFAQVQTLVRTKGLSVLLVEQNVGNALRLAQRGCVLDHGTLVKEASAQELLGDENVQRTYMGL